MRRESASSIEIRGLDERHGITREKERMDLDAILPSVEEVTTI
jgi:hypothetical protein